MKIVLSILLLIAGSVTAGTNWWFTFEVTPQKCPGSTYNGNWCSESHFGTNQHLSPYWGETIYKEMTNGLALTGPTVFRSATNDFGLLTTNLAYGFVRVRWPDVCQMHEQDWMGLRWRFAVGTDVGDGCERTHYRTNWIEPGRTGGFFSADPVMTSSCATDLGTLFVYTVIQYDYNAIPLPPPGNDPPLQHPRLILPQTLDEIFTVSMPNTAFDVASASSINPTSWANEGSFVTDANGVGGLTNLTAYSDVRFYKVTCYTNAP